MKQKVFHFLEARRTESTLSILILASCIAIILESFVGLREAFGGAFLAFEVLVVVCFTLEYAARIWTADLTYPNLSPAQARWTFVSSFVGVIDLVAILPFYLPFLLQVDLRFLRLLRLTRLLRILKLYRYNDALRVIGQTFRSRRKELAMALLVTFVLLLFSSTLMYNLENEAQPEQFPNILASFWWAIATLTTVGYGDVFPVTAAGKFMGGIIALLGVGLVALPAGILSASFMEHYEAQRSGSAPDTSDASSTSHAGLELGKPCPCCGREVKGVV